jgi:hypothetical protein
MNSQLASHRLLSTVDPARTVIIDRGHEHGFVVLARRHRDTVLARVLGRALDRRLAAGAAPERNRLLAARSVLITAPKARLSLADGWDALALRARRSQRAGYAPPDARRQIDATADEIHRVAEVLRSHRPVSAPGVAAARLLLAGATSPTGSLGNRDLPGAVVRALSQL